MFGSDKSQPVDLAKSVEKAFAPKPVPLCVYKCTGKVHEQIGVTKGLALVAVAELQAIAKEHDATLYKSQTGQYSLRIQYPHNPAPEGWEVRHFPEGEGTFYIAPREIEHEIDTLRSHLAILDYPAQTVSRIVAQVFNNRHDMNNISNPALYLQLYNTRQVLFGEEYIKSVEKIGNDYYLITDTPAYDLPDCEIVDTLEYLKFRERLNAAQKPDVDSPFEGAPV